MNLEQITAAYGNCKACPTMWGGPVLFEGEPSPLLIIAEALGEHDLKLKRPLIGPAGQYFNRILAAAGIDRRHVFLMNTVSCRPPNNEIKAPEIRQCANIREDLIEACNPKVILAMGSTAMKALCPSNKNSVMMTRGKILSHKGIPVVVTLHPSYLMRQEQDLSGNKELGTRILNSLKRSVLSDYLVAKRIAEGERTNGGGVSTIKEQ